MAMLRGKNSNVVEYKHFLDLKDLISNDVVAKIAH